MSLREIKSDKECSSKAEKDLSSAPRQLLYEADLGPLLSVEGADSAFLAGGPVSPTAGIDDAQMSDWNITTP